MSTGLIIGIVFLILAFIGSGLFYFNESKPNTDPHGILGQIGGMFLKKSCSSKKHKKHKK
jgi:hypothetical protein